MSLFQNWPELIEGERVYIKRTKIKDLSQFISWRKWEGKTDLTEEEEAFANQRERARKLKFLKDLRTKEEIGLSIFNKNNNLIALAEIYLVTTEIIISKWILKKAENIFELAYESGELLLNYIFKQKDSEINSIFLDIPEYRQESISIILNLGFIETSYYYTRNHKNKLKKMLTFRI